MGELLEKPSHGQEKILVIDDNPDMAEIIKRCLQRSETKFQFFYANGGAEGIILFKKIQPDVVLLDIIMPDINGFEVLEKIKESKIKTRVIILSALDDVRDIVKLAKDGACDYLVKPLRFDELCQQVTYAVNRALIMENPDNLLNMFSQLERIKYLIN